MPCYICAIVTEEHIHKTSMINSSFLKWFFLSDECLTLTNQIYVNIKRLWFPFKTLCICWFDISNYLSIDKQDVGHWYLKKKKIPKSFAKKIKLVINSSNILLRFRTFEWLLPVSLLHSKLNIFRKLTILP